jgi:hypothetical protein
MLRGMDWNFLKGRWHIDRVHASLSELESTCIIISEITLVCVKGAGAKFTSTPMAARSAPRYRCHKGKRWRQWLCALETETRLTLTNSFCMTTLHSLSLLTSSVSTLT